MSETWRVAEKNCKECGYYLKTNGTVMECMDCGYRCPETVGCENCGKDRYTFEACQHCDYIHWRGN